MFRVLIAGAFIFLPKMALAEPGKITGEAIKNTFTGALLELDTPLGVTLPIRFSGDGLMTGQAGKLASYLGSEKDRGRWWVSGQRLCYKWFRWFEAEAQCLSLTIDGQRVAWRRDDGTAGTATITERPVVADAAPTPPAAATAKPPVLKSGPRAAARPEKKKYTVTTVRTKSYGLFSVGAGLSQTLKAAATTPAKDAVLIKGPDQTGSSRERPPVTLVSADAGRPARGRATDAMVNSGQDSGTSPAGEDRARRNTPPVEFAVAGVGADDVLNMRSGPSQDHGIIGFIPPESKGVRLAGNCVELWCQVDYRGTRGWVNRFYLSDPPLR